MALYPQNATTQGTCPTFFSFCCFHLWVCSWVHQGAWGRVIVFWFPLLCFFIFYFLNIVFLLMYFLLALFLFFVFVALLFSPCLFLRLACCCTLMCRALLLSCLASCLLSHVATIVPCTLHLTCFHTLLVVTPLWAKCEGEAHTPKSGNLESSGTPEKSELELKG